MVLIPAGFALAAMLSSRAAAEPRTHDGVMFRIGVGPGYAIGNLTNGAGVDYSSSGANISTQLSVGWTVRPGLVVGGGTFPMVAPSPTYHEGTDAGGQHVSATGPFVDYYFDPHGGLHVQGGLLLALGYLDGGDREAHVGVSPALLIAITHH